jgi:hypothetical protein
MTKRARGVKRGVHNIAFWSNFAFEVDSEFWDLQDTSDFVVPLQNLLSHNKWPLLYHCLLNFCGPPINKICIPINKICSLTETSRTLQILSPLQNLLSHNKWPLLHHCLLNFWSYSVVPPLTKFVFPLTKISIPINKICVPINKICSLTEIQTLLMPALKRHDPLILNQCSHQLSDF